MNLKFLVLSSFLIALLVHLAFFNGVTFVFPIDAASPKPKFFFLGPILTQREVKLVSTNHKAPEIRTIKKEFDSAAESLYNGQKDDVSSEKNPFAIRTINKPLVPQTEEALEKIVIKSTFDIELKVDDGQVEETIQKPNLEFKIQPYRPLKFRAH